MVHTRRKFYDVYTATKSPLAHEALQRIGALYAIEADIRGQTAEHRKQVRQLRSRPLVEAMHAWLTELLGRLSGRSTLAQAIQHIALTGDYVWTALDPAAPFRPLRDVRFMVPSL